jgi:predicted dehydrogenase
VVEVEHHLQVRAVDGLDEGEGVRRLRERDARVVDRGVQVLQAEDDVVLLAEGCDAAQRVDRGDVELMIDSYTAELVELVAAVREGRAPSVTGHDARRALALALACIASVQTHAPVAVTEAGVVA